MELFSQQSLLYSHTVAETGLGTIAGHSISILQCLLHNMEGLETENKAHVKQYHILTMFKNCDGLSFSFT